MTEATTAVPAASPDQGEGEFDIAHRDDVSKLRRHAIGLPGVLFLTVTGSAPITAMLLNTPISVGFGNGIGTPAGFLFATVVLVIFSIGYAAMARKRTTAGGFYAFISAGLGRELGMGTGLAAVLAYSVFEASLAGGFAYFCGLKLAAVGINIAWPWLALICVGVISVLSYFDVRLSAVILGVLLLAEFAIVIIFDIFMFAHGTVPASAINPVNAFQSFPAAGKLAAGTAAIGIFFAFWSWVGFEMAPNYGEESKDPKRIVPLSLYISVIGLGIFYTLSSWAPLGGYHTATDAITQAQNDPYNFYLMPARAIAGPLVADVMSILIITGSFACAMAFHNTTARYLYSLGREGIMPRALGRTHPRWKSPHIASITQTGVAAAIIIAFALIAGHDNAATQAYVDLYGLMAIMGVIIILSVQALVGLAIFVYFWRFHRDEFHWFTTGLAPIIGFVSQVFVVGLLFQNLSFAAGGLSFANWLGPIDGLVVLLGIAIAFYWKRARPEKYKLVGRLIHGGL